MKFSTKKLICALLIFVMTLSFASCKADEEGFYIKGNSSITIQVNETYLLEAVKPEKAKGKVQWESSNEAVAVVADGAVVGIASGVAVITATLGDYSDKVIVTVSTPKGDTGNNNSGNTGTNGGNTGDKTGNNTGNNTGNTGNTGDNTTGGNTNVTAKTYSMADIFTDLDQTTHDVKTSDNVLTFHLVANQYGAGKGQIRVYANNSGVISSSVAINKFTFTANGKANEKATVKIEYSTDGSNWIVATDSLSITSSATNTVTFSTPATYIRITSTGKQLQITEITIS